MKGKEIGRLLGDTKGRGGYMFALKLNKYVFNYIAQAPSPAIPLKISLQNFFICKSEILGKTHIPQTAFDQIHWSWEVANVKPTVEHRASLSWALLGGLRVESSFDPL